MAKQSLEFTQTGNKYTASFVSTGTTVVQVKRNIKYYRGLGSLVIYAYIDGMEKVVLKGYTSYEASNNMMFQVEVPAGLNMEIVSDCPVQEANILTEE